MSLSGYQINTIDVNFHLQKNSADKVWSKKYRGWKVPCLKPQTIWIVGDENYYRHLASAWHYLNTVLAFPTNSGFIIFFNLWQTFESVRSVYCVATNIEYLSWETFCHSTGMVALALSFWSESLWRGRIFKFVNLR